MTRNTTGHKFIDHSRSVFRRIFPKKLELPSPTGRLLRKVYPKLDFNSISFFEGLPWFIDKDFASAITLPGIYNLNKIHIYFARTDFTSPKGMSTAVHECYHALQYQELYKSRGVGLFRIFMLHYLAEFFMLFFRYLPKMGLRHGRQLAYERHSMEVPAFEVDRQFYTFLKEFPFPEDVNSIPASLVIESTGHRDRSGRFPYWLTVVLLIFLTLLAPVAEFFILVYALLCFLAGKVLSFFRI